MVRLNILFEEKCIETWCKDWKHSEISEELKHNVRYHVQGCLAIISRWVESNFTHSMDELVKIIADIDKSMEYYIMKKQKNLILKLQPVIHTQFVKKFLTAG